jgi:hypothetical protein
VNWFKQQRLNWIGEMLIVYGFINRKHIQRKFDVSSPQAALDLRDYMANHSHFVRYNLSARRYENTKMLSGSDLVTSTPDTRE